MRFFSVEFFHQIASPDPIRGTLGHFWFLLKNHRDIQIWTCLPRVRYTVESTKRSTLRKTLRSYLSCKMVKCASLVGFLKNCSVQSCDYLHLFGNGLSSEHILNRGDTPQSHNTVVYELWHIVNYILLYTVQTNNAQKYHDPVTFNFKRYYLERYIGKHTHTVCFSQSRKN